jgi:aminomethyltransferase
VTRKTALHDLHVRLGGRIVDFSGWLLPVQFEGVLAEHRACRSAAVVFDTSHMGQFHLHGGGVVERLGAVCTQDPAALAVGRCRYGFLLNEDGGVLDDTVLMRLGEREFLLVVNAGPAAGDLAWLTGHLGGGVELIDRQAAGWGKVDVQGPASARVLRGLIEVDLAPLAFYGVAAGKCCGQPCVVSRTGYTGELGYEIMAAGEALVEITERLLATGAVKPAGLGARDSLRLEMGYPLYGHELTPQRTPIEAGLGGFARLDRQYIGAAALREHERRGSPPERLVAFRAASRRRTNNGDEIRRDGRAVGTVTSGAFAPSLDVSIGMGYVQAALAADGSELVVKTERAELPVTVCAKPLYDKATCRTKDIWNV